MKKVFILIFIMCCSVSFAVTTTIKSSIYANSANSGSNPQTTTIPFCTRKVHITNHVDSMPELATALAAAERIFSKAMQDEQIDLVEIKADVVLGDASDSFDMGELCKVEVRYSNIIIDNFRYHEFSALNSTLPLLYPAAMTNQTTGVSDSVAMVIHLNPTLTYYCGIGSVPAGEYDMITVLLRALAIGCGLQSSLDPNIMEFGVTLNGNTYITPFDAIIYNNAYATIADVVLGDISIENFLSNHLIYVDGYARYVPDPTIILFNDWELGAIGTLSKNTLNTISSQTYTDNEYNNGFLDLLDYELRENVSIREVTPYTMALLRVLGWMKSVIVGFENLYEDFYDCSLQCSSNTLQPNTSYTVSLPQGITASLSNVVCKLSSQDSAYVIGSVQGSINSFSYASIPQDIQWQRNPMTKNIMGQMQGEAHMLIDDQILTLEKTCDIEIPYIPNRPLIQKSESTENGNIHLNLHAFANGSDTYTVSYTGVTYSDYHTFTIAADVLDTILISIPANQLYNMSIYGTNNQGNSSAYNFTFGFSAHPALNLTVVSTRTYVKYDLSDNGQIDLSDVVISSVQIRDHNGLLVLTSNAGSGEQIPTTSLPRGLYVLSVVANGDTYSKLFVK